MGFDRGKLDALRRKYGESHGGEMFDPKFRKVADKIFSKSGTRLAPYSGIPTFLDRALSRDRRRESGFRRPAGGDHRRADGSRRHQPAGLALRAARAARHRAHRPLQSRAGHARRSHELRVADIGDVPFRSRYRLETQP